MDGPWRLARRGIGFFLGGTASVPSHFSPCCVGPKRLVGRHGGRPSHENTNIGENAQGYAPHGTEPKFLAQGTNP